SSSETWGSFCGKWTLSISNPRRKVGRYRTLRQAISLCYKVMIGSMNQDAVESEKASNKNIYTRSWRNLSTGYIKMATGEVIEFELYEEAAPRTATNFEKLANENFYDGLTFHRVIPGFVSQGGCPNGNRTGNAGYTINCETEGKPHKHAEGSLSMAHAGKDTGSCQFFSVHEPQPHLDGVHTVFGQVTSGFEHASSTQNGGKTGALKVYA